MSEYTTAVKAVQKLEALGTQRAAVMAFVADQLKTIDNIRKEVKDTLTADLKGLADVSAATAAANIVAPTEAGADQTRRKQISRRRKILTAALASAYPLYNFSVRKEGGAAIVAEYVGTKERQEAAALLQSLERLQTLGLVVEDAPTVDALTAAIEQAANITPTTAETVAVDTGYDSLAGFAAIKAKLDGLQATIKPAATPVAKKAKKAVEANA